MKIPDRTETQKKVARVKFRNLYIKNPNISWILDDESYFTLSHVTLLQHKQVQSIPQLRNLSRNNLFGLSFLKGGKVYENGWRAKNLDELRNKIRLCTRNMDQNLVQDLLASASKRLNRVSSSVDALCLLVLNVWYRYVIIGKRPES
ncbi:hypothetical protein BpHYR1_038304 [Brachionus plicatilis]|uniref:Uncharacterized protein n=1 Tax=Brachionus plicatilis TaxID=10195 RepID=A0A3M7RFP1_BRAPC|nr:hypothetical protein BpHYR1_038304 [Brachionus plicatilis]